MESTLWLADVCSVAVVAAGFAVAVAVAALSFAAEDYWVSASTTRN